ncbi:MAG: S9 family peptidase [Candidatus Krumholzibacteriota bacterium]|nr:S9 family peptidase [Candidatus Krumholzibacteriota bacterium]
MKRLLFVLAAAGLIAGVLAVPARAETGYLENLPPIIDREVFFGDPEIAGAQISPDGKHISFLKEYHGKLNIWVKRVHEPFDAAKPMTADTTRPVRGYAWSRDGRYLVYVQDKGGDENFLLYRVDPKAEIEETTGVPPAVNMTPFDDVRVMFYSLPKNDPDIVFIGLNDRDQRYHDLYRLRLSTGERTLIRQNDEGYSSWIFDLAGELRMVTKETDDGGTEFFRVDDDAMTSVYVTTNEENAGVVRFHKDGRRVYLDTNRGEDVDLSRLVLFDLDSLEETLVETDPKKAVDFGGAVFSEVTDEIQATYYDDARTRIYFHDKEFKKDYDKIRSQLPDGDINVGSRTSDENLWIISVTSDVDPGATYLYDRRSKKVSFLYRPRPDLPVEYLAEMRPVKYKAPDGLEIHGYLTVPKGVKAKHLPVVILPHGGPWARDSWGYDPYAQFLANRGYAVMQPNFRSSTGYGKHFFNAGKREWGDAMQDDLTAGVEWLIDEGIADPAKVGIFGGSYGGYATLAGLAFTPDVYACGISYVGVSNLLTLLGSIPPYWETARKFFNEHVGDPDNPEDRERLMRQSPLFSADKITAPLLVVQGANDPRVKQQESDQIVIAMRDLGREVEYMLAPNEGHGFLNPDNRIAMTVAMENFFEKHLGGRVQEDVRAEIADKLDGMMIDVETVTLEEKGMDPEEAKSAALPAIDPSLAAPSTRTYASTLEMMGQEIPIESKVVVAGAVRDGADVWHVLTEGSYPMGSFADTTVLDAATLLPIAYSAAMGPSVAVLSFSEEAVTGSIVFQGNEMPINEALAAPVLGNGNALDLFIESMRLEPGMAGVLRNFDYQQMKLSLMTFEVTGLESVTVPAGTFTAFKIEVKNIEDGSGGTMFVSEKAPRMVLRSTMQMPASQGGGTVTSELVKVE